MPFNTSTQIFLPSKPENLSIVLWNFLLGRQTGWLFTLLHAALASALGDEGCERFAINYSHALVHFPAFYFQLCLIRNNFRNFSWRKISRPPSHVCRPRRGSALMKNVQKRFRFHRNRNTPDQRSQPRSSPNCPAPNACRLPIIQILSENSFLRLHGRKIVLQSRVRVSFECHAD